MNESFHVGITSILTCLPACLLTSVFDQYILIAHVVIIDVQLLEAD